MPGSTGSESSEQPWLEEVDPDVLRHRREKTSLLAGALVLFALAGILAYWLRPVRVPTTDIILAAEYGVRRQIEAHGMLRFEVPADTQVDTVGDHQYFVRGAVLDLDPSGRSWRYFYSARVDVDESRGTFNTHDVSIVPQF